MANKQEIIHDSTFDLCKDKATNCIHLDKFYDQLEANGILKDDFRLKDINKALKNHDEPTVNLKKFKKITEPQTAFMDKIFNKDLVIPDFDDFKQKINDIYETCKKNSGGKNADYIPELDKVDSSLWGVSVCTVDGQQYSIGDSTSEFTIQSCSKALSYAMTLEKLSEETVHKYVGQEPSGREFNEIVLDKDGKPHNPMINAGAITISSLLLTLIEPKKSVDEKFELVKKFYQLLVGEDTLSVNLDVFKSERDAANRNYALGFYMRERKVFPEGTDIHLCLDLYFKLCSTNVTSQKLCKFAATLANGGVNPVTGIQVLKTETVRDVLSLMQSCGMYDYSGHFAFNVGLPAKSGVGGGIMLVIPNVAGICTFAPPLDAYGNSVKGVQFCEELVKVFKFHPFDNLVHTKDKKNPRRSSHLYEE